MYNYALFDMYSKNDDRGLFIFGKNCGTWLKKNCFFKLFKNKILINNIAIYFY